MGSTSAGFIRKRFLIRGNLHGTGVQSTTYRIVKSLNLRGWMQPNARGFEVQLEGDRGTLRGFERQLADRIRKASPGFDLTVSPVGTVGDASFKMLPAHSNQEAGRWVQPDRAQCPECIAEMLNPGNRRFFFPFTFCAECGPRFSLGRKGLLNRDDSVFAGYGMCEQCQAEVDNSRDRRFLHHLNTCPICGPHVELLNHQGAKLSRHREALIQAAAALDQGRLLAIKDVSGFRLVSVGTSDEAIRRMRAVLGQPHVPLALMLSTPDALDAFALMEPEERNWLLSAEAPCVRLPRRPGVRSLSELLAPDSSVLDVCLPESGIFQLLLNLLNMPLAVAYELQHKLPYACQVNEAIQVFEGMVDFMLVADMPLLRPSPRTLVQRLGDTKQTLQLGFGATPFEMPLGCNVHHLMALGGRNDTSIGFGVDDRFYLNPSLGALKENGNLDHFFDAIQDGKKLFDIQQTKFLTDGDPQGLTTQYALSTGLAQEQIDHELAHVMTALHGADADANVMGVCFDEGRGGQSDVIGGGDVLWIEKKSWQRVATFAPFWMPGGDYSTSDNRGCLYGMLYEVFGRDMWDALPLRLRAQLNLQDLEHWNRVFELKLQCRRARSVGRWWQGVSALLSHSIRNRFHGDSWAVLNQMIDRDSFHSMSVNAYERPLIKSDQDPAALALEWKPMLQGMIQDLDQGIRPETILCKVCDTFGRWMLNLATAMHPRLIVLSGIAFENGLFTDWMAGQLRSHGFQVLLPAELPLHDGGLAAGQILAHARGMDVESSMVPSLKDSLARLTQSPASKPLNDPLNPT